MATLRLGLRRRVPVVLQSEAAECGLACLAMIAAFHGDEAGPSALRRRFGFSLTGATLRDLVAVADRLGLASRAVRVDLDELALLKLPCVLHFDMNHFVVLTAVGRNGIVIHDPAEGVRRLTFAEASRHVTGVALELTPTGGFRTAAAPPRVKMSALIGRMVGLKRALLMLLLLAGALEVFALLSPLFLGLVVDQAIVSADIDLITTLALAFGLLLLLRVAVDGLRGWLLIGLGAKVSVQSRANLFSHLAGLPAAWFEARHTADVMSRFDSQEKILDTITTDLVIAVLDGLMCIVTIAVMAALAPGLALVVAVGTALYALLRIVSYAPLRQASAEAIVWNARQDSHFLETLRGIKTVKLFNAERERRAHWLNLLVESVNRELVTERLELLFRIANALVLGLLALVVIVVGARSVVAGTFSVGLLIAFIAYKDLFVSRVSALIDTAVELRMLGLHAERLADIALSEPEETGGRQGPSAPATPPKRVAVEVRDLAFRYGANDPFVLDGVSFAIAPGESVAIAGPSGCGKTTLLKLLAGLLTPTRGAILIDGVPVERTGLAAYRSILGVVMQDDHLFAGSIGDNIAFFAADADDARIEDAAEAAAVAQDVEAMPMGYGTLIGDMGTALSGGQKQRVLLARALYRRPALLLLDEATSHLDLERERAVNTALARIEATRVVIAHRPETIHASARVITLENGRVARDDRRPCGAADRHPGEDRGGPGDRGADAGGERNGDMGRDRADRPPLGPQRDHAPADGCAAAPAGPHEPLF